MLAKRKFNVRVKLINLVFSSLILVLLNVSINAQNKSRNNKIDAKESEKIFNYDQNASPDVQEISKKTERGVEIIDLTYASPKGGRVSAYLVSPEKTRKKSQPGLIFQHWMMAERTNANRTEFLDEAIELAREMGAVSLLLDAPMKRADFKTPADNPKGTADIALIAQTVTDLRRGIDVLLSRPEIDRKRIGFVGHSFGAGMGGILLGIEARVSAFVLMAAEFAVQERNRNSQSENFVKWRARFSKDEFEDYLRRTAPVDPAIQVVKKRTAPVLLQYAKDDEFFTGEPDIVRATNIVAEPKIVKIYADGGHELNSEARRDRKSWLKKQFGN